MKIKDMNEDQAMAVVHQQTDQICSNFKGILKDFGGVNEIANLSNSLCSAVESTDLDPLLKKLIRISIRSAVMKATYEMELLEKEI